MLIKDHTQHIRTQRTDVPKRGGGDDVKDGTEKGNHISYKVDY